MDILLALLYLKVYGPVNRYKRKIRNYPSTFFQTGFQKPRQTMDGFHIAPVMLNSGGTAQQQQGTQQTHQLLQMSNGQQILVPMVANGQSVQFIQVGGQQLQVLQASPAPQQTSVAQASTAATRTVVSQAQQLQGTKPLIQQQQLEGPLAFLVLLPVPPVLGGDIG